MKKVYEGNLISKDIRYAVVISRFNEFIGNRLLSGCYDCLERHGVKDEEVDIYWVPGAFEIPVVAKKVAKLNRYDAIICLGVVIRGATPHFDYICAEVTKGIAQVSLDREVPISYGILTTDSIEQAIERAGTKSGNKGWSAALSAIEMVNLVKQIS